MELVAAAPTETEAFVVSEPLPVSAAVTDFVLAVLSVTLKLRTPLSPEANT